MLSNAEESFATTNTEIQNNLRKLPGLIAHLNRTLEVVETTLEKTQEEMGAVGATFGAPAHLVKWTGNLFKRKTAANESADNDDSEEEDDERPYDDILAKI